MGDRGSIGGRRGIGSIGSIGGIGGIGSIGGRRGIGSIGKHTYVCQICKIFDHTLRPPLQ